MEFIIHLKKKSVMRGMIQIFLGIILLPLYVIVKFLEILLSPFSQNADENTNNINNIQITPEEQNSEQNSLTNSQVNTNMNKPKKSRKKVIFKDISSESDTIPSVKKFRKLIQDLQDPITGDPIRLYKNQFLYQCKNCSVFYLKESFEFLNQKNSGKCVSCSKREIVPLFYDGKVIHIKKFDPETVTLDNYKLFVDTVIKFRGKIVKILESRRGDYALMFEDTSWVEGFKLIVFYPLMKPGKGLEREFLQSLVGKNVVVRGLLKYHEIYGYEILIFKRNMILSIEN